MQQLFLSLLLFCGLSSSYLFGASINQQKRAEACPANIVDLLKKRFSGRSFDSQRFVSQEQMVLLAEAARFSPSCYNDQPWTFIFCNKKTNPKAYDAALSSLVPFNQEWASSAPLLIVVSAAPSFRHNDKPNRWSAFDTGAATMSLCIQATSMGLMTHQMGGFDEESARKVFHIPADYQVLSIVAVGYEKPNLKESDIKNERRPSTENFFQGTWGIPLQKGD